MSDEKNSTEPPELPGSDLLPEAQRVMALNLKLWRKALGLSQEQVAVMMGISMIKVQRLERAQSSATADELMRFCAIYGHTWADLVSTEPSEPNFSSAPSYFLVIHPRAPATELDQARLRRLIAKENDRAARPAKK